MISLIFLAALPPPHDGQSPAKTCYKIGNKSTMSSKSITNKCISLMALPLHSTKRLMMPTQFMQFHHPHDSICTNITSDAYWSTLSRRHLEGLSFWVERLFCRIASSKRLTLLKSLLLDILLQGSWAYPYMQFACHLRILAVSSLSTFEFWIIEWHSWLPRYGCGACWVGLIPSMLPPLHTNRLVDHCAKCTWITLQSNTIPTYPHPACQSEALWSAHPAENHKQNHTHKSLHHHIWEIKTSNNIPQSSP